MKRIPFFFYLFGALLFSCLSESCVEQEKTAFEQINTSQYSGYLYLCTRATESKEGRLVMKYNNSEEKISHIGIAFSLSEEGAIYNMYYDQKRQLSNDLVKETNSQFFISEQAQNNKIWAIPLTEEEYKKALDYLNTVNKKQVQFDFKIDTSNDTELYCSELVYNVLIAANANRFALNTSKRKLKQLASLIMKKDEVIYYPVDFFLSYQDLTPIDFKYPKNS